MKIIPILIFFYALFPPHNGYALSPSSQVNERDVQEIIEGKDDHKSAIRPNRAMEIFELYLTVCPENKLNMDELFQKIVAPKSLSIIDIDAFLRRIQKKRDSNQDLPKQLIARVEALSAALDEHENNQVILGPLEDIDTLLKTLDDAWQQYKEEQSDESREELFQGLIGIFNDPNSPALIYLDPYSIIKTLLKESVFKTPLKESVFQAAQNSESLTELVELILTHYQEEDFSSQNIYTQLLQNTSFHLAEFWNKDLLNQVDYRVRHPLLFNVHKHWRKDIKERQLQELPNEQKDSFLINKLDEDIKYQHWDEAENTLKQLKHKDDLYESISGFLLALSKHQQWDIVATILDIPELKPLNSQVKELLTLFAKHGQVALLKELFRKMGLTLYNEAIHQKPIEEAVKSGQIKILEAFLQFDPQSFTFALSQKPLIHLAAEHNRHNVINFLAKQEGFDVDKRFSNTDNATALHIASKEGHLDTVLTLLKLGADRTKVQGTGRTPLHWACFKGHLDVVRALVINEDDLSIPDEDRSLPLHWAACSGFSDIAEFLIQKGANIDAKNTFGNTPLILAIIHNHPEFAKALINNKADLSISDADGLSLLHIAAASGSNEITEFLIEKGANVEAKTKKTHSTPLFFAARYGHFQVIETLIKKGKADINAYNREIQSPLHIAAASGHINAVKTFISHGAKINSQDNFRDTPLSLLAIYSDRLSDETTDKVATELLLAGASVTKGNPLFEAARNNSTALMEVIISNRANANIIDKKYGPDKMTPLFIAAKKGHLEAVDLLLNKGANPNIALSTGSTPLHKAVLNNHPMVVTRLLEDDRTDIRRKKVHIRKWIDLKTAFDLAYDSGHQEIIDIFQKYYRKRDNDKRSERRKPSRVPTSFVPSKQVTDFLQRIETEQDLRDIIGNLQNRIVSSQTDEGSSQFFTEQANLQSLIDGLNDLLEATRDTNFFELTEGSERLTFLREKSPEVAEFFSENEALLQSA